MTKKLFSVLVISVMFTLSLFAKNLQVVEINADMDCKGCKNKIEKKLRSISGVEKVNADLKAKLVKVEYDKDVLTSEKIVEAINETGTKASLKNNEKKETKCSKKCSSKCNKAN
ncbi:MAG: heavy-metal-associated domain-containing protein [Ignavibacteria bacterium]|nr:heavy-metal-associated domain-containing protein [Ignavibacteria bacterium]